MLVQFQQQSTFIIVCENSFSICYAEINSSSEFSLDWRGESSTVYGGPCPNYRGMEGHPVCKS